MHFMLPDCKSKNYSRSYEFRQIICPLNKHSQNKQHFDKIFKIQVWSWYQQQRYFLKLLCI